MNKYSAEWLEQLVLEHGYTHLHAHDCSMCGYECGYRFSSAFGVMYDPGCYCTSNYTHDRRTFQDIADWLAMQSSDAVRDRILTRFSKP